jgi:arylsulfatase A-like enzyme
MLSVLLGAYLPLLLTLSFTCVVSQPSSQPSFLFMLGDDIGWSDFSYNNGTAVTPRIKEWITRKGSILLQDFHTGGTVCSPTRATILTGRNHFRDCVNYVYDCSDPTQCTPDFEFAPRHTFTVADAVRAAGKGYVSHFGGKWHLGSLYNDSESLGGITSSPVTHGFDLFNATIEVSPTATTNCQCKKEWAAECDFGHNDPTNHCAGDPNGVGVGNCCFNYWHQNSSAPHGVSNTTFPTPDDDSTYNADAFIRFLESRAGAPFLAQISFHNCHIPFVGTPTRRAACEAGTECSPPLAGAPPYTSEELDFYACLNELDASVGSVLDALVRLNYYDNTMTWFSVDNGPEVNCKPEGRCGSGASGKIPPGTLHRPDCGGAGSAGPLRGRKRDVWEGGHRVPGVISWPAVVAGGAGGRVSWDTVTTMDFMATVMDVLGVSRPPSQASWAFDGVSVLPLLRGEAMGDRGVGWMYLDPVVSPSTGYAFRYGKWKYVAGGISCDSAHATFNCSKPQLYDMSVDWVEDHDLAEAEPVVLAAIATNFSTWYASVLHSIANESMCTAQPGPSPPHPTPFPPNPTPSTNCTFFPGKALNGADIATGAVDSREQCCGACVATPGCVASDFVAASRMKPTAWGEMTGGTCHLKSLFSPKPNVPGEVQTACHVIGRGAL